MVNTRNLRRPRGEREADKIVAQLMANEKKNTMPADEVRQKFFSNKQQGSSFTIGTFKVSLIDPVGIVFVYHIHYVSRYITFILIWKKFSV